VRGAGKARLRLFSIASGKRRVPNLVEMSAISKAFGGSAALRGVSLELSAGSVHALMGENGAGKSTLMKILAGVHHPDSGEIRLNGRPVKFAKPRDALDAGVSTVFQELSLLSNLSIAENMFLGREPTTAFGAVDYRRMEAETLEALAELELKLDPGALVSELSIAERQFVEIAHGIKADAAVFILDEPTAALNAADVEILNKQIRRLRDSGKAIVYISHRIDEIFNVCDVVTVLKDGERVGTRPLSGLTADALIAMMVGRELSDLFPPRSSGAGDVILDVKDFQITPSARPFSFAVRRGEIVALAGLEGQGQQRFLRSLIGDFTPHSGNVSIKGRRLTLPSSAAGGTRALQKMKVGYVPEDRKEEGLFLDLSIRHNIAIALHSSRPPFAIARRYRRTIEHVMSSMHIRAAGPRAAAKSLSGGNQQKVLLGRYLATEADLLLIEEPTRGVDVGAKAEIYKLLRGFAEKGGAIVVLSREIVELIGLCDRIVVMHANTTVGEMRGEDATEHAILDAALNS
jgi:ribose transport system ATP-binding protein